MSISNITEVNREGYGDGAALMSCLRGFVRDSHPARTAPRRLREGLEGFPNPSRILCLGKAAPALASAAAGLFPGVPGLVYGTSEEPLPQGFDGLWGDHPLPTPGNEARSGQVLEWLARGSGPLLACVSGGSSALLEVPAPPWRLAHVTRVTEALLASGAPIGDINAARVRLSLLKGGGLLEAVGAFPVATAVLSDVGRGVWRLVGSAPTLPWRSKAQAEAVFARFGVGLPLALPPLRPRPRRPLDRSFLLDDAVGLRRRVAAGLRAKGWRVSEVAVPEGLSAESLARAMARRWGRGRRGPSALVGAGEAPVDHRGRSGRGGRCSHLAAAAALALSRLEHPGPWAFAALATDGVDGTGGAGAFTDSRGVPAPERLEAALAAADTAPLWEAEGSLVPRRPSGNNLRDIWILAGGGP